jgi:hypothetical protein
VEHCVYLYEHYQGHLYPVVHYLACNMDFDAGSIECQDPLIYAAVYNTKLGADTYKYHEAMHQPDWELFQKAALDEIKTLEQLGTWTEITRDKVPKKKQVLGGTWVFKCKRTPEGVITKHKARFCV